MSESKKSISSALVQIKEAVRDSPSVGITVYARIYGNGLKQAALKGIGSSFVVKTPWKTEKARAREKSNKQVESLLKDLQEVMDRHSA